MKLQMLLSSVLISFVIFICGYVNAKLAPDFIVPCNDESRECLVKATQNAIPGFVKGMPNLGVSPLDPLIIDKVSLPLTGINFTFYNGKLFGLRNSVIDNVVWQSEKHKFTVAFHCNLTIAGIYEAKGNLLLFTIDGGGDALIKLINLKMNLDFNTKFIKDKNNVNHVSLVDYKYTFNYGDRIMFNFQNLFKESKQLSDTVLQFINENGKAVAEELGKPIVDYIAELIIRNIEKFLHAVPYEELINVPIPQ